MNVYMVYMVGSDDEILFLWILPIAYFQGRFAVSCRECICSS